MPAVENQMMLTILKTNEICAEVAVERERQDDKWGQQNHDPFRWMSILGEEVGECHNAVLESYSFKLKSWNHKKLVTDLRTELIQVAAVAVAMVECLDRDEWTKGRRRKSKTNPDDVLEGQLALGGHDAPTPDNHN